MIFMTIDEKYHLVAYLVTNEVKHLIPEDPHSLMRFDETYDYWRYRAQSLKLPFHASRLAHEMAILSWKRTKNPKRNLK